MKIADPTGTENEVVIVNVGPLIGTYTVVVYKPKLVITRGNSNVPASSPANRTFPGAREETITVMSPI